MQHWYALHTKPQRERFVQDVLQARAIKTYLPLWHPPQASGRSKELRPYFPCYLFAQVDMEIVGLWNLQYAPGVNRLVYGGTEPATIGQAVIDAISRRLAELEQSLLDLSGKPLVRGDRIVIVDGPFQGYQGIFDQRLSAGERVRILIEFSQKRLRCEMEAGFVQRKGLVSVGLAAE